MLHGVVVGAGRRTGEGVDRANRGGKERIRLDWQEKAFLKNFQGTVKTRKAQKIRTDDGDLGRTNPVTDIVGRATRQ